MTKIRSFYHHFKIPRVRPTSMYPPTSIRYSTTRTTLPLPATSSA